MAVSKFMQLLSLSRNSDSDESDESRKMTIRHNDHGDATDLDLSLPPRPESYKVPITVTRIWDRPNGIRSEYPQLGNTTYLDHGGTTVRRFPTSNFPLALLTEGHGHSFMQLRF